MWKKEQGQALLIIVLVMVVALTVGLSVVSKSITNLRTSTEEANSQKALAAAEAGIEQAIKSNASIAERTFGNKTTYETKVTEILGTSFVLNAANPVLQDNGIDIWLSDYSENPALIYNNSWPPGGGSSNLTIKWGSSANACNEAALQVVIFSGTKQNPVSTRYAFDPCQARRSSNNFTLASASQSTVSGKTFYYQADITISQGLIGRIVPLYASSTIALTGSVALPKQGLIITSTGESGGTQRKVNVFQGYPEIPSEYFLYNLFSP